MVGGGGQDVLRSDAYEGAVDRRIRTFSYTGVTHTPVQIARLTTCSLMGESHHLEVGPEKEAVGGTQAPRAGLVFSSGHQCRW